MVECLALFRLDFNVTYQYTAADEHGLVQVSFDTGSA